MDITQYPTDRMPSHKGFHNSVMFCLTFIVSNDHIIRALPCPDSNCCRSGQGMRRLAGIFVDEIVDFLKF